MSAAATIEVTALYASHSDWLREWLRGHTRCPHRAADLTQDTFHRLLEKADLPTLVAPRNYLAKVARRLLIDDVRRFNVERVVLDALAVRDADQEMITPERIAEAIQLLDAVRQVLDALPAQAREAFRLRRIEGLEQSAIADRLGVSLSTVKRLVAFANAQCLALLYAE